MTIDLVTVSSRGQVVLPKAIRNEEGITEHDKLLVMTSEEGILLQKVDTLKARRKLMSLLDYFRMQFRKSGITREDVAAEIAAVRAEKYGAAGARY